MIPRVINKPAAVILLWEVDELTWCVPGAKSRFIGLKIKEKGGKYFWPIGGLGSLSNLSQQ
jgi:hypothetical protein